MGDLISQLNVQVQVQKVTRTRNSSWTGSVGTSHVSILNTVWYSSEKRSNTSEDVTKKDYIFLFLEVKLLLKDSVQETDGQRSISEFHEYSYCTICRSRNEKDNYSSTTDPSTLQMWHFHRYTSSYLWCLVWQHRKSLYSPLRRSDQANAETRFPRSPVSPSFLWNKLSSGFAPVPDSASAVMSYKIL